MYNNNLFTYMNPDKNLAISNIGTFREKAAKK